MPIDTWLLYVTTILAFMSTPGPSHLLMLSNSMSHGFRPSLATAAGDLTANALQMLAASLGLAAVLIASQSAFAAVKWAGVAYLIWMGIRTWQRASKPRRVDGSASSISLKKLWFQGFFTSAANPKAVVFFAALFPQFIHASHDFMTQAVILGATYIIIDGLFLTSYGASAAWIARRLKAGASAILDRIGGTCLIAAAVLLGLKTLRGG